MVGTLKPYLMQKNCLNFLQPTGSRRKNFRRERHRSRPSHLVKLSVLFCFLGVPTLMSRMLDAEELDFSFGQTDSLTHRLNVLLQDYTDGFAVPKELVQNADDAGATEVRCILV